MKVEEFKTKRNMNHLVFGDDFRFNGQWWRCNGWKTPTEFYALSLTTKGGQSTGKEIKITVEK